MIDFTNYVLFIISTIYRLVRSRGSDQSLKNMQPEDISDPPVEEQFAEISFPSSAGMSPYISLKIKKRHYEHHMIETHR